ncbi:MAG: hypothetical protein ACKVQJ_03585 [Pyrinomonadaceae bacterium]
MKITLAFETVVFDRLHLRSGQVIPPGNSFELFRPTDSGIENEITKVDEESILRFFMTSPGAPVLFKRLGASQNPYLAFSVKEPVRKNAHHPDFDLIICDPGKPH